MQLQPPFILSLLVKDQEGFWLPRGSPLCHRSSWRPLIGQVMYGYFYDPQAYKAINKSPSFTSMEKRCRIQQWLSLLYSFSHSSYCICSVANPFFLLPKKKSFCFISFHYFPRWRRDSAFQLESYCKRESESHISEAGQTLKFTAVPYTRNPWCHPYHPSSQGLALSWWLIQRMWSWGALEYGGSDSSKAGH